MSYNLSTSAALIVHFEQLVLNNTRSLDDMIPTSDGSKLLFYHVENRTSVSV